MIFLGNSILGQLNKEATSQKSIGLPFWRLVIASGIIVFTMGFVNLFTVSGIDAMVTKCILTATTELHLPRRQTASYSPTSPIQRRGCISQGRR